MQKCLVQFIIIFSLLVFRFLAADEPIFMNTLPKSGSVYIIRALCEGLSRDFCRISKDRFPEDDLIEEKLIEFVNSNHVTQEHINASPRNVELLKRHGVKLILHVRDPRQAVLSWTHFLRRVAYSFDTVKPEVIPPKYFTWSFKKQLEHQIQVHFPDLVQWIADWLKVYRDGILNMKILTYEDDFHHQPDYYFKQVLDFFNVPLSSFDLHDLPKTMDVHFRKGKVDEWRSVFTSEQQRKVTEMMSDEFFSFFSWSR